jgi:hypothetical protein
VPGRWNSPPALRAAGGALPDPFDVTPLILDALNVVGSAALTRASGLGIGPLPGSVHFAIGNLGGDYLGLALPAANTVLIDDNAAGHGWFVDPTPLQDKEFAGGVALAGGPAAGKMDLLTVVLHELGHLAGLDDSIGPAQGASLMSGTLPAGVRRL